jgi:transposase-like protein
MGNEKVRKQKSAKLKIRQRRVFSEAFKREKVAEIVSGQISVSSFCRLWDVSATSVYRWIYRYSDQHQKGTTMVIQKESEAAKVAELQKQIAKLEQALGQKQMVIDYQDKLIEEASKELGMDIKKNTNAKR